MSMGPWIDEKTADIETLVDEFENACRAGDHEYAPEYKAEILRRLAYKQGEAARQQLEIAEADAWCEYWRREAFREHPTQEAYDSACKALWKHRDEAARLRKALEQIVSFHPSHVSIDSEVSYATTIHKIARQALSSHTEDTERPMNDAEREAHRRVVRNSTRVIAKLYREDTGIKTIRILHAAPFAYHEEAYQKGIRDTLNALGITIPGITDGGDEA